jgi:hypothetical protein
MWCSSPSSSRRCMTSSCAPFASAPSRTAT